ncbi:MAG TPA: S1 RNA-binding domain-containing protein [Chloroflexota bacterium]|nr:S1 RNA-binding domain-containing protein [Chloroflexota bacterium]
MQPSEGPARYREVESTEESGQRVSNRVETYRSELPRVASDPPEESMGQLMADAEQGYRTLRRGDMLEGTVVSIDREGILVDVGTKSEGVIPLSETQRVADLADLAIGDTVYVIVVQPEGREGHAVLSLNRARSERGWRTLQAKFDAGEIFPARVVDVNRGGLVAEAEGVRGFVPISQISSIRVNGLNGDELDHALRELVGRDLAVKVLELSRPRNRLIFSERVAAQELRGQRRDKLLAELQEGEIRHGRVSSLSDFGAFVDLGGADGLVHLSELAWHQVSDPSEVVQVGDEVDVYVLAIDRDRRKISLSLRRTQPEPWATAQERYPVGSLVTAKITRLTTFGAFARLDDGIEGLIHVSELSNHHVAHPRNVVHEGETLTLRVLRVEPERRRLGLSLRQVEQMDHPEPLPNDE